MYPVSQRFIDTIMAPHQMVSVAQVITPNETIDLNIMSGSVPMDSSAETMRTLSAEVTGDAWDALITPGAEIKVWRGIVGELVPLGVFIIDADLDLDEQEDVISLSGADRSRSIARALWIEAQQVAKGTNVFEAITTLIITALPQAADWLQLGTTADVIGSKIVLEASESSNPWLDVQAIARAYGYRLVFDGNGYLTAIDVSVQRGPVWTFGGETAPKSILSSKKRASFADVYNGVTVIGEGSEQATNATGIIRATAWDDDELSPTYYNGAFGRVPKYISSALVTTLDQGLTMAKAELAKYKGIVEQEDWAQLVHPALEPYDQVEWIKGNKTTVLTIDKLTIPLDPAGEMSGVAREVRA